MLPFLRNELDNLAQTVSAAECIGASGSTPTDLLLKSARGIVAYKGDSGSINKSRKKMLNLIESIDNLIDNDRLID